MTSLEHIRFRRLFILAWKDKVFFLASALSFDAMLVTVPLLLLFLSIAGFVREAGPLTGGGIERLFQLLLPGIGNQAGNPVADAEEFLRVVADSRSEFGLLGLPMFVLFSTRLFSSVRVALDQILHVKHVRRFWHDFLHDLMLVGIVTAFLVANTFITLPVIGPSPWAFALRKVVGVISGTGLFFVIYLLAPTKKPNWDSALMAAMAAAVVFELTKGLYGIYLANFLTIDRVISNTNAIAFILFALWIYVTALIFLLGAEIGKVREVVRYSGQMAAVPDTGANLESPQ